MFYPTATQHLLDPKRKEKPVGLDVACSLSSTSSAGSDELPFFFGGEGDGSAIKATMKPW